MARLSTEIAFVLSELSSDAGRMMRIEHMRQAFARAIRKLWANNPATVRFVLSHINAVYIRKDDKPRKGPDKDKPFYVCEVYSDDSGVRAELDNLRQILEMNLHEQGLSFDEFRIFPSKFGMKERHPYEKLLELDLERMDEELRKDRSDNVSTLAISDSEKLNIFKRAIILTFPEHAEGVLDKMNAVGLTPEPALGQGMVKRGRGGEFCNIYTTEETLHEVIMLYKKKIMDNSFRLGLRLRNIKVSRWNGLPEVKAFPSAKPSDSVAPDTQ